jgi:hypothetical protein
MRSLLCLYSCAQDQGFKEDLMQTPLLRYVQEQPGFRILEVRADEHLDQPRFDQDRLTVACPESYLWLAVKTWRMVQAVLELNFDVLLKLDVTIVRYAEKKHHKPAALMSRLTPEAVHEALLDPAFFQSDYNGLFKQSASQEDFEKWLVTKGIEGDYRSVFRDGGRTPDYFLGKFYLLSRPFCQFIATQGGALAVEHQRYLGGSEDVMIGRLYDLWLQRAV